MTIGLKHENMYIYKMTTASNLKDRLVDLSKLWEIVYTFSMAMLKLWQILHQLRNNALLLKSALFLSGSGLLA